MQATISRSQSYQPQEENFSNLQMLEDNDGGDGLLSPATQLEHNWTKTLKNDVASLNVCNSWQVHIDLSSSILCKQIPTNDCSLKQA